MEAVNGRGQLVSLVFGHMATHVVGAMARLGLADAIVDGRCSGPELAARLDVDRVALARPIGTCCRGPVRHRRG